MSNFDDDIALTVGDDHEIHGETVTYRPIDAAAFELTVIPRLSGLSAREADQGRTAGYPVVLDQVKKADLSSVNINEDEVDIPGSWVREFSVGPEPTVRLSVAAILNSDRSNDAYWTLGLGMG